MPQLLPSTAKILGAAALLLLLGGAVPAAAADPEAIDSPEQADASFEHFARQWMANVQEHSLRNPTGPAPPAAPAGAAATGTQHREYGTEFSTELRATGRDKAPYVGLLRYTESTITCSGKASRSCKVDSTTPVTEIFRYEAGHWIY